MREFTLSASDMMRRALELAEEGRGHVSPNPLVGAVIVRDGQVVGEGYHAELGRAHAEVVALEAAGEAARGATMHVTLEPCSHDGRTPPCTDAIVDAGIARVVYAAADPHPEAAGGAAALRAAGVEVERAGPAEIESAVRQNATFLWSVVAGRPFVALKLAMTIDGKLAAASGRRTEITGPEAWERVHRLRADADAVLVGRGTVTADDPRLTARAETEPREQPIRVVLDSLASLASDSALVSGVGDAPVVVVAAGDAHPDRLRVLREAGVETEISPRTPDGLLDPYVVLRRLHDRGIRSVLVEGGARTADSFLAEDLVERFHHFVGPWFIGPRGVPAFVDAGSSERDAWHLLEVDRVGDDAHMVWERRSAFDRILRAAGPDAG
ncbi:MAG: bifunctional diaminohydroxyphosphoribosylaminopyrimidine deaminase/5-amino-6-(5-phosphoribosylamino)uracil reductase RibD [Gemmatimonadota bacterium]